jgi:hypothetical protein
LLADIAEVKANKKPKKVVQKETKKAPKSVKDKKPNKTKKSFKQAPLKVEYEEKIKLSPNHIGQVFPLPLHTNYTTGEEWHDPEIAGGR